MSIAGWSMAAADRGSDRGAAPDRTRGRRASWLFHAGGTGARSVGENPLDRRQLHLGKRPFRGRRHGRSAHRPRLDHAARRPAGRPRPRNVAPRSVRWPPSRQYPRPSGVDQHSAAPSQLVWLEQTIERLTRLAACWLTAAPSPACPAGASVPGSFASHGIRRGNHKDRKSKNTNGNTRPRLALRQLPLAPTNPTATISTPARPFSCFRPFDISCSCLRHAARHPHQQTAP